MDSELVADSLSDNQNQGSESDNRSAPISYTETFYEHFPYYLAIGMTATQYWDDDCTLPKYYREAEQIRLETKNRDMWLQGMYIYDAMSRLTPLMHAFAKKGTRAKPYIDEPYPISKKIEEKNKDTREKTNMTKGLGYMQRLMAQSEIYFEERKE